MSFNYTLVGSPQDIEKFCLLLRDFNFEKIKLNHAIVQQIPNIKGNALILIAGRRNLGMANKVLENANKYLKQLPVIVVSALKDADLLLSSLKVNLVDFIVDCGNSINLKKNLLKALDLVPIKCHKKKILAIGAHPDDIEIGCGGALLRHKKLHHDISILTMSQGSYGGDKARRVQESEQAAKFLNATLWIHDLEDTKVPDANPTIEIIQKTIEIAKPDIIYTHSFNDNHQDHRAVHKATLVAAREIDKLYAYLAPSSNTNFNPRHFEVIENYVDEKVELIQFHASQSIEKARPYMTEDVIKSTATYWGRYTSYLKSEPFEVIKS